MASDCAVIRTAARVTVFPYTTLFRSPERARHDTRVRLARAAEEHRAAAGEHGLAGHSLVHGHRQDRKSTRLNSSHSQISYADFGFKKKSERRPPRSRSACAVLCPASA